MRPRPFDHVNVRQSHPRESGGQAVRDAAVWRSWKWVPAYAGMTLPLAATRPRPFEGTHHQSSITNALAGPIPITQVRQFTIYYFMTVSARSR
jgi:hypothetical protein